MSVTRTMVCRYFMTCSGFAAVSAAARADAERLLDACRVVDSAALHDEIHLVDVGDGDGRVTVDQDHVGELAGCDHAALAVDADHVRRGQGGHAQHFGRGDAGPHVQLEL